MKRWMHKWKEEKMNAWIKEERKKRWKLEWKDTRTNKCINKRKKGRKDESLNERIQEQMNALMKGR